MKRIILYIVLSVHILTSSCSMLDLEPTTSWTGENFPKEEAHLNALLNAGYERLQAALQLNFLERCAQTSFTTMHSMSMSTKSLATDLNIV